ncbi:MAG: hypothetical protein ACK53V_06445 [Planctomycetota bacterium]
MGAELPDKSRQLSLGAIPGTGQRTALNWTANDVRTRRIAGKFQGIGPGAVSHPTTWMSWELGLLERGI